MSTTLLKRLLPAAARMAPETPEQVALVMDEARRSNRNVVVVSTGHGIPPIGDTSERVLLDMKAFDQIRIDPGKRTARVGGAVRWRELLDAATPHKLTAPFGSADTVGVTGYLLGGGLGHLSRHLGLGCSAILAAELVTPQGQIRRIDDRSDPDLFWALRGGGGGFGVVTSLDVSLAAYDEMSGGVLAWSIEDADRVLRQWSDWTASLPDDVTSTARLFHLPEGPATTTVTVTAARSARDLKVILAPLLELEPATNTVRDTDPSTFLREHTDPPAAPGGPSLFYEHVLLDLLPAEACKMTAEFAQPDTGCGAMMIELRHLGGKLSRPALGGGALDRIDGEFSLFVVGGAESSDSLTHAVDVLSDYGRGRTFLNFMPRRTGRQTAFDSEAIGRLSDLYEAVDPEGLIDHPHPIRRSVLAPG